MSAEEAIARARAIAERLKGSGATAALTPVNPTLPPDTESLPVGNGDVEAAAEALSPSTFTANNNSGSVSVSVQGSSSKRKRWGTDINAVETPVTSVATTSAVDDAVAAALAVPMDSSAKRVKSTCLDVSRKVWIPVEKNPGYNYIGLLIGPGGSKQRELIEQSGGNVKISIRGRGSSSNNHILPGQPEEPLHCLLEGNIENVEKAEKLVSELLNDSAKAQAEKDRQLAVVSASKALSEGDQTTGVANSPTNTYQPKPVAHLLGLGSGGGHYGPGASTVPETIEEKIGVPNGVVGFIIGKGGESITSMQRRSGCRVQIQKEHEMDPGSTQRVITLTGPNQESISMCRGIIEEMVQERLRMNQEMSGGRGSLTGNISGGGPGANAAAQAVQLQQALAQGQAHVTVQVPNNDVGLIIGKGGTTIRSIQDRSNANVQIPQGPDADNPMIRTINITHPAKEGADFAKTLIEEIMKGKFNQQSNFYGNGGQSAGTSDVTVQVQIPDKDVGMCIGKSGCVIREMQQKTGTRIQIPSQPTPGQQYRIATVSGPAEGCQKVHEMISRISLEQSSQFVMTGAAFQHNSLMTYGQYGQQHAYGQYRQQQTYNSGQNDYGAQWAAYYASLNSSGLNTLASQGTNNATGASTVSTSATVTSTSGEEAQEDQQQPAADAYYDAFFRYMYHYGEDAARKYYGAWSPPQGTPNPYGVNPNSSLPDHGNQASATISKGLTEDSSLVKDSSVRGVSNLPAWMNRN